MKIRKFTLDFHDFLVFSHFSDDFSWVLIGFVEALEHLLVANIHPADGKTHTSVRSNTRIRARRQEIILGTPPIDPAVFGERPVVRGVIFGPALKIRFFDCTKL